MKNNFLKWLPRVLAIAYILFISIFAFDVFSPEYSIFDMIIGFLIHLIPSFILIIVTIIAWKKEFLGGILFILLSILFTIFFNTYKEIISFILISLILFIIGLLFILFSRTRLNLKKTKK